MSHWPKVQQLRSRGPWFGLQSDSRTAVQVSHWRTLRKLRGLRNVAIYSREIQHVPFNYSNYRVTGKKRERQFIQDRLLPYTFKESTPKKSKLSFDGYKYWGFTISIHYLWPLSATKERNGLLHLLPRKTTYSVLPALIHAILFSWMGVTTTKIVVIINIIKFSVYWKLTFCQDLGWEFYVHDLS